MGLGWAWLWPLALGWAGAEGSGRRDAILAPEGTTLALFCDPLLAAPNGTTAIWYHDGRALGSVRPDANLGLGGEENATDDRPSIGLLVLHRLRREASGDYWCSVGETGGGSPRMRVEVAYLEAGFVRSPGWAVGRVGEAAELECVPPRGHPAPSVVWLRGGRRLSAQGRRLRLAPLRPGDEGRYTCLARNAAGQRRAEGFVVPESFWASGTSRQRPAVVGGCGWGWVGLWVGAGVAGSAASAALYALALVLLCPEARRKRRRWVVQGSAAHASLPHPPAFLPASHILRHVPS